jgi:hypothetical protein
MLQSLLHYGLHFLFPALIAWAFFRNEWKKAYLIMLATMLVDLDHLLANPIFDPNRCSIGFHFLHSYYAILIYFTLLLFPKSRIVAIGLLLHMLTDYLDCNFVEPSTKTELYSFPAFSKTFSTAFLPCTPKETE